VQREAISHAVLHGEGSIKPCSVKLPKFVVGKGQVQRCSILAVVGQSLRFWRSVSWCSVSVISFVLYMGQRASLCTPSFSPPHVCNVTVMAPVFPGKQRAKGLPRSLSNLPLAPPESDNFASQKSERTSTGQSETDFPLPPPTETPTHVIDSDALKCVDESCRLSYRPLSGSTNF
jgi:hypothetical protein